MDYKPHYNVPVDPASEEAAVMITGGMLMELVDAMIVVLGSHIEPLSSEGVLYSTMLSMTQIADAVK